jgi:hypothetical protein
MFITAAPHQCIVETTNSSYYSWKTTTKERINLFLLGNEKDKEIGEEGEGRGGKGMGRKGEGRREEEREEKKMSITSEIFQNSCDNGSA